MGSSNVIRPEATVDSILQTLGFVSIMFLIGVAAYAFIKPQAPAPRVETAPDLQPAE